MIARWVGVVKVNEGDVVPDGASYTIHPEVVLIRFQFLRVIGADLKIGLVPCIGTSFKILRRARVESWQYEHHPLVWGWTKVFEIQLTKRGQYVCVEK